MFLFKNLCINCSRVSKLLLCQACNDQIQKLPEPYCFVCKSNNLEKGVCLECKHRTPLFKDLVTLGSYTGILKKLIYELKYDGIKKIAKPLGSLLGKKVSIASFYKEINFITSIPLHHEKYTTRKFNQAELIAKEVSKELFIPYYELIARLKETEAQHALSQKQRELNLKHAFTFTNKKNIYEKNILIVDDIFTSGSTIQEATQILKEQNCNSVYVAVIARSLI